MYESHVYTTNYASKTTQEEDTKSFQKVCNAIVKRIQRQANEREKKSKEMLEKVHEFNKMEIDIQPDFIEGLSRLLSGIAAHMSSNIVSAPMAHFLVDNDSRFKYSHNFSNPLLSQLEDFIDDETKDITFQLRKVHCKNEKVITWPEIMFIDQMF